ncbi:MAG: hypothetical protein HW403_488 [Dehalococcoidia bacterium]|nr:hypothetical protein [Dehalococcoidia bacterium]
MRADVKETAGVLAGAVVGVMLAILMLFTMMGGGFILALLVLMVILPMALVIVAVEQISGYRPMGNGAAEAMKEPVFTTTGPSIAAAQPSYFKPVAIGTLGAGGLFALYFVAMTWWEGFQHTSLHMRMDWMSIVAVAGAFGVMTTLVATTQDKRFVSGKLLVIGVVGTGIGMFGLLTCCTPLLYHLISRMEVLQASVIAIRYSLAIISLGVAITLASSYGMWRAHPIGAISG